MPKTSRLVAAREILSDALILSGVGGVVYGASLVSVPAAWMTGGAFVAGIGYLVGRA